jgi:FkbM family methyltransferase
MLRRSLRLVARRGAGALEALAQGRDVRTVLQLRGAGIFKLPIVFGDLRPGMAPVIVDVGAARGESGRWALHAFPNARIHSIEPIATEFAELEKAAARHDHWHAHRFALGGTSGRRDLIVCENIKQASSFFAPTITSSRTWPEHDFATRRTEAVEVRTLWEFARDNGLDMIDILKLDVQGAELEVLRGAGDLLARIRYIIAEVAFQPMYEGGCLFPEVMAFLHERGKFLRALANEARDENGHQIQADALFG